MLPGNRCECEVPVCGSGPTLWILQVQQCPKLHMPSKPMKYSLVFRWECPNLNFRWKSNQALHKSFGFWSRRYSGIETLHYHGCAAWKAAEQWRPSFWAAISSVAPSRVARNMTSDRHHGDYRVPENLHGHRIIQSLRELRFFVLYYW